MTNIKTITTALFVRSLLFYGVIKQYAALLCCNEKEKIKMGKIHENKKPISVSVWLAIIAVIMIFLLVIWLSMVDLPAI